MKRRRQQKTRQKKILLPIAAKRLEVRSSKKRIYINIVYGGKAPKIYIRPNYISMGLKRKWKKNIIMEMK